MWSAIVSAVLKNIIPKILESGWLKWVLMAVPFIVLVVFLIVSRNECSRLKETCDAQLKTIATMQEDIDSAKKEIAGLKSEAELVEKQTQGISDLLKECHSSIVRYEEGMRQIDSNMEKGANGAPLNKNEKGEKIYVPVTKEQNASGIDFVNKQLNSVK